MLLPLLLASAAHATIPAAHGVIHHAFSESVTEGTPPMLRLKAPEANVVFVVQCTAGEQTIEWETGVVPQGEERLFALAFEDTKVRDATCGLFARMANGLSERKQVELHWEVVPPKPGDPKPTEDADESDDPAEQKSESLVTPKAAEGDGRK